MRAREEGEVWPADPVERRPIDRLIPGIFRSPIDRLIPGIFRSPSLHPEIAARTITITSATKSFNISAPRWRASPVEEGMIPRLPRPGTRLRRLLSTI
jgi:hypothetical protein